MKNKYRLFLAVLLLSITFIFIAFAKKINERRKLLENTKTEKTVLPSKVQKIYGITIDTLQVIEGQIKLRETLASILSRYNIPDIEIDQIAKKSEDVFDVKKIKTGNKYTVLCTQTLPIMAEYFIYEVNPADYVVFQIKDTINVHVERKQVDTIIKYASGIINSSLYETMIDNNLSPVLANSLSEVFAWQIDFFRIQKGDNFKVIYEEKLIDGIPVGIGKIKGAYFKHFNEDFYAVYFEDDDKGGYFDEEANSLQKVLLRSPLKYSRISSRFSWRRYHPVQKRYKAHLGTDYAAPRGTPIRSVGDGIVTNAAYHRYNGNYVKIRHNSIYTTGYLHMTKIAKGIKSGIHVKQGQVIGYVGSTGLANGPHVCFRFWKHGQQVNPFREKIPPSRPVKEEYLKEYNVIKEQVIKKLDKIEYQLPKQLITANQ